MADTDSLDSLEALINKAQHQHRDWLKSCPNVQENEGLWLSAKGKLIVPSDQALQ